VAGVSPDQQHRCTVQTKAGDGVYLAFEPADGGMSSYSNSLFTLDLSEGATTEQASELAAHINTLLRSVSTTIF
jgi:hypothetical protein